MGQYIGLDGFRGGWVAAWIDDQGNHGFDYSTDVKRLLSTPHTRAMIDVPIGLTKFGRRICDVSARKLLGSSVFLGARRDFWKFPDQASANQYYWRHEGGERVFRVSFGIFDARSKRSMNETDPELIFWKLNGCVHLESKKSATGRDQPTEILRDQGFIKITKWLTQRYGTGIGRNDLIDACACPVAARDSTSRLGGDEIDIRGLRMGRSITDEGNLCPQEGLYAQNSPSGKSVSSPDSKNISLRGLVETALLIPTVPPLPRRPRLAPELTAAVHRQRFPVTNPHEGPARWTPARAK